MMFDSPEEEEAFRRMLRECARAHTNIDDGIKDLYKNNQCHHFAPFGNFVTGRSIIISEIIDEYGHLHLLSFGSRDLRPWEIKGMLSYVAGNVIQGEEE
jgi:hypothetical protein